jgi:hypothetical protein
MLLIAAGMAVAWLGTTSGGSISGTVVDAETHQPVADAYVQLGWTGTVVGLVHSASRCVHEEVVRTDEHGHFRSAPWIRLQSLQELGLFTGLKRGSLEVFGRVYKAGYDFKRIDPDEGAGEYAMSRFRGASAERLEALRHFKWASCWDSSNAKSVPVLQAIRAEIQAIPAGPVFQIGDGTLLQAIDSEICFEEHYAVDGSIGQKEYEQCASR